MTREQAIPYIGHVVDDAGSGGPVGSDPHKQVRNGTQEFSYPSRLVGWQCGFEPLFVAVHSHLDVPINDIDAESMAMEYLVEIGWFGSDALSEADYIL